MELLILDRLLNTTRYNCVVTGYGSYVSTPNKAMYAKGSKLRYTYFGARYGACPDEGGNSELSVWLSVDHLADKYPFISPFMYTAGNPVMLVDPNGLWDQDADGNWIAKKGDSWWSLHKDSKMSWKETMAYAKAYNAEKGRDNWKTVRVGDQVTLPGNESTANSASQSDLSSQLSGVEVANIPDNSQGEITPFVPNFYDNWSESDNLLASFSYGIVDDAYVYGTALVLGPDKMRHLTGEGANRKELTNSGLYTLTNFVPIPKMGKALGIGKQTLNIAEYSSKYAGTKMLKGFTPAQRGMNLRIRNVNVQQNNALIKTLPRTMWGVSFTGFLTND
jgi:hypothetical protein